ncbi:MAG TPA: biotin/lipoyl-binding protein [Clostridiales bacterium]|nr:biotin/lipoyl-binding protein [Clostridiales bacterium]
MRKFIINVNGKSYEVEVEEVRDGAAFAPAVTAAPAAQAAPAPAAPAAQPAAPAQQKPEPQPSGATGSVKVTAPMPGNILDIRVKAGDTVEKGQVVLILEAMKMENEIMAPQAGKIASINTSKGSVVNSGDLLFTMD